MKFDVIKVYFIFFHDCFLFCVILIKFYLLEVVDKHFKSSAKQSKNQND